MKKESNLLDEFLQEKVEHANIHFKEDYWQSMSALLDEEEKKKKRPFFFWRGLSIFAILLLVGVGTYLFPKWNHSKTKEKQSIEATSSTIIPSAIKDEPIARTQESTPNTSNTLTPNTENNLNSNSSNTEPTTQTSSLNNGAISNLSRQVDHQVTKTSIKDLKAKHSSIKHSIQKMVASSSMKKDESNSNSESELIAKAKSTSMNVGTLPKQETLTESTTQPNAKGNSKSKRHGLNGLFKGTNSRNSTVNSKQVDGVTSNEKKNDAAISNSKNSRNELTTFNTTSTKNEQVLTVRGKEMKVVDTVHYSARLPRDESKYNPRYIASLSNYIPEHFDSVQVITLASKNETASNDIPKADIPKASIPFDPKPFDFYMLFGLNMNKAFKGNVTSPLSIGFSPYVGVGVEKQISEHITLASHIGFTYFNGLNTEDKITSTTYSFGIDSSEFIVQNKKMFDLYVPLSIYYQILKRHFLMASIGASYSLDVSSKVQETSTAKAIVKSGYRAGFNQFDLFAQVGYSYQISNNFMVQFGLQQGFLDMTKNAYFNNSVKNTKTRLSIGIKYNFKRN